MNAVNIVSLVIGVGGALISVGVAGTFGLIVKRNKKAKARNIAYKKQTEDILKAQSAAIKGLAANNGQSNASYVLALDAFEYDEEIFNRMKENALASANMTTEKEAKKITKIKM